MKPTRRTFLKLSATGLAAPAILMPASGFATPAKRGNQITGVNRMQVGSFEVTALLDGALIINPKLITGYDEDIATNTLSLQHLPAAPEGQVVPVTGYLVNTGDKLIAIDCGTTDSFVDTLGNYHTSLASAGVSVEQIDHVITTHLHVDHIGGLTDGKGNAMFPNADLITNQVEWDFWHNDTLRAQSNDIVKSFFDIARTQTAPYNDRITIAQQNTEITPGVELVSLPGHTPGHIGVHLRSNGDELLIWGDIIHATKLQFENPDWTLAFDIDQDMARTTRTRLLDQIATDGIKVAGMHLDFPGFGHVTRSGKQYRFEQTAWDYNL